MAKKKGLALMILGGKKPEKKPGESYEALLATCSTFLGAAGLDLDPKKEKAACESLLDFVHIAMDYEP